MTDSYLRGREGSREGCECGEEQEDFQDIVKVVHIRLITTRQ